MCSTKLAIAKRQKADICTQNWTDKCQDSFDTLKNSLTSPPVLGYADMNKPFVISTRTG